MDGAEHHNDRLIRRSAAWRLYALAGICLATGLLLHPQMLPAAAPANDTCAGAIAIPPNGPFPYLTPVIPDIRDATTNGDPVPSCDTYVSRGTWFSFTPQASHLYHFSLSPAETLTTVPLTVMAVYSSTGPCSGLQEMGCNDDDGCTFSAEILANLSALQRYYLCVWQFGTLPLSPAESAVQLHVSVPVFAANPPPNDLCQNAQVIPTSGPFPYLTTPVDISVATAAGDPVPVCHSNSSWAIWYKFKPVNNGVYNFSTCYDTATTVCDTLMAVYASSADCSGISPTALDCEDDNCIYRASITSALSGATNYYIVVWGKRDDPPSLGHTFVQVRVSKLQPRFISAQKSSGGSFQVQFSGIVGSNYTVQASTNLKAWQSVGQLSGSPKGANQFIDTAAGALSNRSYRITSP